MREPIFNAESGAAIAGLIARDSLVPERAFYKVYGSRAVFARWRKEGLKTFRINGHVYLYPSELERWLKEKGNRND